MATISFPPHNVRYTSLDPPGTKRVIPAILQRTYWNAQELSPFFDLPAYDKLPRWFIPSRKLSYRPPLMHYGWNADFPMLVKLAEDRGLTQWNENIDYSDTDPDDLDAPGVMVRKVNNVETISLLLETVAKELVPDPPKTVQLVLTMNAPDAFVVSVYTNYDLAKPPSDSFVEMLRVALNGGELRWFLDEELLVCSSRDL
ncbi:hypothetical protein B0H21DRAFT_759881 [Amylocystis lapponica]|nr:hypothetical protein B0H21DRAFT_759881 [Amylocystis lapponica]